MKARHAIKVLVLAMIALGCVPSFGGVQRDVTSLARSRAQRTRWRMDLVGARLQCIRNHAAVVAEDSVTVRRARRYLLGGFAVLGAMLTGSVEIYRATQSGSSAMDAMPSPAAAERERALSIGGAAIALGTTITELVVTGFFERDLSVLSSRAALIERYLQDRTERVEPPRPGDPATAPVVPQHVTEASQQIVTTLQGEYPHIQDSIDECVHELTAQQ